MQLGAALGLAVFTAPATARTRGLLAAGHPAAAAQIAGFQRALLGAAVVMVAAAVAAVRASNTRDDPVQVPAAPDPDPEPVSQ